MTQPKVAIKAPAILDLAPGIYSWCTCGLSEKQPFCDRAHRKDGVFRSLKFEILEPKKVALCQCKQTKNPPHCDGSHSKLDKL